MSNSSHSTMSQLGQLFIRYVSHQKFSHRTVCIMFKGLCLKFKKRFSDHQSFLVFLLLKCWWLISLLKNLNFLLFYKKYRLFLLFYKKNLNFLLLYKIHRLIFLLLYKKTLHSFFVISIKTNIT